MGEDFYRSGCETGQIENAATEEGVLEQILADFVCSKVTRNHKRARGRWYVIDLEMWALLLQGVADRAASDGLVERETATGFRRFRPQSGQERAALAGAPIRKRVIASDRGPVEGDRPDSNAKCARHGVRAPWLEVQLVNNGRRAQLSEPGLS